MDGTSTASVSDGADLVDDVLAHYGIRGMKWGVRRSNPSASGGNGSGDSRRNAAEISEDAKAALVARAKPPYSLSNKEMQTIITRMNLEQQYDRLTATPPPPPSPSAPPSRKAKTAKFIGDLLIDVGKTELKRVVKGQAAISVENGLRKSGQGVLADRIGPGKGKKDKKKTE